MIRVTVWNEYLHERTDGIVKDIYPEGIHKVIADFLGKNDDMVVTTVVQDDPENGLTDEVLNNTDVLIWCAHIRHYEVSDAVVNKVKDHVLRGMGFIPLHSAHMSKPFTALMGTSGTLKWRDGDRERLWCLDPSHPIAAGVPETFVLDPEEMYGEYFDIPKPDSVVFMSWFRGGEVFRSGCTFTRGYGKIFYFRPGHEANPTYYNENVQKIITNAVRWACPTNRLAGITCPDVKPVEGI